MSIKGKAFIAGAFEHPTRKAEDKSLAQLHAEVAAGALADAGLTKSDVDGYFCAGDAPGLGGLSMAEYMGLRLRYTDTTETGGSSYVVHVRHAALAIAAGKCDVALITLAGRPRAEGMATGTAPRVYSDAAPDVGFESPFGPTIVNMYAMAARRHMHEFGTTSEQMAAVALACRAHAQRNPRAVMRAELTLEQHQASRLIADPLRLYDCCLESDGACAVIVTTAERARDLKARPVRVLSVGQGAMQGWGTGMLGGHNMPDAIYASANQRDLAAELYGRAGIGPADVDVVQLYDAFTPTVLFTLEDFGFCPRGEAGPFAASGALAWPNGALPCNTSGGNLSEAYIHGFNLIAEGARQMRGESTCQVEGAEVCVVSGGESVNPTSAAILVRV